MISAVRFLTTDEVAHLQRRIVVETGGTPGVLSHQMLESAVHAPQAWFAGQFLNEFPFLMSAALMCGLARNDAFVDANKRTATAATEIFLRLNGRDLRMTDSDLEDLVLGAATGRYDKEWVASRLAGACVDQPD